MDACPILGARWLGDPSGWGALGLVMASRRHQGGAGEGLEGAAAALLAEFMALEPPPGGAGLFIGPGPELGFAAAAARHGLAGSFCHPAPGVAGGLALAARAVSSLQGALPGAVCLAAGGSPEVPAAACLCLAAGSGQGLGGLGWVGKVELGHYEGPEDSGLQAGFLEDLARRAMAGGGSRTAAVVMNEPPSVKLQATLDAAARRAAPRARRYRLPLDKAGPAGGLRLIMAALFLETPLPQSPRLVLAFGEGGDAAAAAVMPA